MALVSAILFGVSALRSRQAKQEAIEAAQHVASGVARLAQVQGSRQAAEQTAQASSVTIARSQVQHGRSGWRVDNGSDQPITDVEVSGVGGEQILLYLGSGPEQRPKYVEPTVGAHQQSQWMFRPTGTAAVHADDSDLERMALRFTDARNQTWEKIGTAPVRLVNR